MRTILKAALWTLPVLLATPRPADAAGCCSPFNFGFDLTIKKWCSHACGCGPCFDNGGCCLGGGPCPCYVAPWYLYWPMEAHFQAAAPTGFPFWPAPMMASGPTAPPAAHYGVAFGQPAYYGYSHGYGYFGGYGPPASPASPQVQTYPVSAPHQPVSFQPAGLHVPKLWFGQ
ncbi:MAG: hypothetical protein NZ700_16485 [Gemmataceae bacterium]|nr:hypothetical protein [Gemmataceae bacterium]MDW8264333.1 hypothetical protein [Gemmataceae bacterium]